MVKVSVVLPIYNVEPYLRKCLDSLLGQTLKEIQIIAVDDGSPDNSASIVDEYAEKDSRVYPIHKKNGGVSAARNDGLSVATGKYIFFCDSDDWLDKSALEILYDKAEKENADVVIGDFAQSDEVNHLPRRMFSNEFSTDDPKVLDIIQEMVMPKGYTKLSSSVFSGGYCMAAPWHHLIRHKLIKENHLRYNLKVRGMFDDGLFMLEVFEHARIVAYVSKITYYYRVVPGSITNRYNSKILEIYQSVYQEIDLFIRKYNKNEAFCKAYALRIFAYLNKSIAVYFLRPENKKSDKEKYKELLNVLRSEPYVTAIKNVNIKDFGTINSKVLAIVLRLHLYKVYWNIKKCTFRV